MSGGPDGLEERTAYAEDRADYQDELHDALADRAENELLDIAQARMMAWAIDRVLG